jgi:hypothetical protein
MPGFDSGVIFGNNIDMSGTSATSGAATLLTNGQLLIATTALNAGGTHVNVGTLTSPGGTLTIGYSSPNITLDLAPIAGAIQKVNLQAGTSPIVPTAGAITLNGQVVAAGGTPVRTDGTGVSTGAIQIQTSQAIAATDATKIGLSSFNSSDFSVDANGFVSIISSGFTWNNVTGASATLAAENGYQANNAGLVTLTLPTTASSTFGDTIKIMGLGAGGWTIAQLAGQQIQFGSSGTTVGVGGSLASTNRYDAVEIVYSTTSGLWRVVSSVGNLTVT